LELGRRRVGYPTIVLDVVGTVLCVGIAAFCLYLAALGVYVLIIGTGYSAPETVLFCFFLGSSALLGLAGVLGIDVLPSVMLEQPRECVWTLETTGLRYEEVRAPKVRRTGRGANRSFLFQIPVWAWPESRSWGWSEVVLSVLPKWQPAHMWQIAQQDPGRVNVSIRPREIRPKASTPFKTLSVAEARWLIGNAKREGGEIAIMGLENPERVTPGNL